MAPGPEINGLNVKYFTQAYGFGVLVPFSDNVLEGCITFWR